MHPLERRIAKLEPQTAAPQGGVGAKQELMLRIERLAERNEGKAPDTAAGPHVMEYFRAKGWVS
jgi:hypothetical protein